MNPIASIPRMGNYGTEQRRPPKVDWLLILSAVILLTIGFMSLYSEGMTRDGDANFRKQAINTLIGIAPFCLFAFVHPKVWQRLAYAIYGLNVLMLLSVFVIGKRINGAERWVEIGPIQFQPSDLAKLLTILTLSAFFANRQESISKPSTFLLSFLHVSVPMALIFFQPHLGSAMVIFVSWFAICVVAGVPGKYLGITVFCFLCLAIAAPKIGLLRGYQMGRTSAMGKHDSKGANYQTDQAAIAFAEGGLVGTGYEKGVQKAGHFIPEQNDDFIITVLGEEGGLVGTTMALCAFGFFFYRLWLVMFQSTEFYYRMLVGGVFAALAFHTFVNIAMVLGIVPVVGLWLPFLSYGGTAMWLCMSCVALALNIRLRERPLLF